MAKRFGALLLGAAFFSIFLPGRKPVTATPAPVPGPEPKPQGRKRLWALVQVKPQVVVLAISDSREDLEVEVAELNETWNHWDLRTERHRYDIQPVCMLQTAKDDRLGLRGVSRDPAIGEQ
jgi:hypothetical protein